MTPIEYYRKLIESDQILKDDQQAKIIDYLQVIYDALTQAPQKSSLFSILRQKPSKMTVQGIYLWGKVGVGKTFLIDCFFYCLPLKNKLRIHFHQFMKEVHEQLQQFREETNPLEKVAKQLARKARVICFDELIINDIADAMLLAGLFKALYKQKICLIFTSNTAPDNLYLKGLQRDSFLPAIELIKQNAKVVQIKSDQDYRFKDYQENMFYYFPLNQTAEEQLEIQFEAMRKKAPISYLPLHINERDIKVRKRANGVIWFDFLDICGVPRSQNDYLAIATNYHTVIVSHIIPIQPEQNDLIRSFINLIDVLYDSQKKLVISADKPIEQLYICGRMLFEFARTRSRLVEMQSLAWHKKCDY